MTEPNEKNLSASKDDNSTETSKRTLESLLRYRRILIFLAHIAAFSVSLALSFLLIKNMQMTEPFMPKLLEQIKAFDLSGIWELLKDIHLTEDTKYWISYQYPLMLLFILSIKLVVFGLFRQYSGWWRYVGISDLLVVAKASLVSTIILVTLWYSVILRYEFFQFGIQDLENIGDGVILTDLFITVMMLAGLRMLVRLYHEEYRTENPTGLTRLLIIGAGDAGEALLRETMRMKKSQYEVIGFIDDDPRKKGVRIHGIGILGTTDDLPEICKKHNVEEIAIPSANHKQLRNVIQICQGTKIRFRTVPSITDIASGKLKVTQIRDVDIDDLLGRDVVELDLDSIETFISNKTILVTGAGGSIGSEMCRQVCKFGPKLLLLVEQAENPLFFIERELRKDYPDVKMMALIRDITNKPRIRQVFDKYKPQVVIHAAAHKHVPLMEDNPGEAIVNNIMGSKNVCDCAADFAADDFVMISTDKAVNPTSIMGSTKRIAEMYVQSKKSAASTHFTTVRFGNVLGSNGSVVPIFNKQIAAGGPVTVTHPDMERYFMTIPEASQLVLQAATLGKGGEIFVLDMGEPVKIVHLARELITLSGFRPDEDIEIVFSGMRPGEKLFEELSIEGEDMLPTKHPKIAAWQNKPVDRDTLKKTIANLVRTATTQDHKKLVEIIKTVIPEYIGDIPN
ncbi:MAG: polysaccharide biosynthesis protein [Planctomycetes bacterium]|nr:polysaccharide biosynthesis protein [Planctomycetota bacterium]